MTTNAALHTENDKFQKSRYPTRNNDDAPAAEINDEDSELPDEQYIHNAGLILVWPFLPALFQRCNLTNEKGFISESHASRAVILLEYLVTGSDYSGDLDLSLNKVLCGIELNIPVVAGTILTAEEKDTVNGLLASVVAQWPILGNTSIDGLRGSFLIRKGRLTINEKSFSLLVEKASFDVLLDHLQWSIGMIKLSWMKKNIIVTWRQ